MHLQSSESLILNYLIPARDDVMVRYLEVSVVLACILQDSRPGSGQMKRDLTKQHAPLHEHDLGGAKLQKSNEESMDVTCIAL